MQQYFYLVGGQFGVVCTVCISGSANINELSLAGMQLPEGNFHVSSEGPSSIVFRRRAFARHVEVLLIFFI